jgi:hypothetical protein
MPHQGNSPSDIIGYDGQGRPIYKGHNNGNGVRRNSNGNRNTRMRNGRAATRPTGRNMNNRTANANPVTRTFFAPQSPRYYRPNGQIVPVGAPLHQHQNGTIMTEHAMGPNDNSVVVTTSRPRMNNNRRRTTRTRTNGMRNTPTTRTTTNRVNQRPVRGRTMGGRRTGGTSY